MFEHGCHAILLSVGARCILGIGHGFVYCALRGLRCLSMVVVMLDCSSTDMHEQWRLRCLSMVVMLDYFSTDVHEK